MSTTLTNPMNGMTLPYREPLETRALSKPVIPEPHRRGEPGGPPCGVCDGSSTTAVWGDDLWTLHPPVGGSMPGSLWMASREHADSFMDLSPQAQTGFGVVVARVEKALLSVGDFARVHLYRWGDGGAHFHVWFMPRPLGMLEATGMMLPLWEDVLPNVEDEELRLFAEKVAAVLESEE
jgi:hypothetical protein